MRKKLICLLLVFTTVIGCAPTNDTSSSSSINISDLINSSSESIVKHSVTFMDGKEVISVIEVEHNKIISDLPSVPSKDGYTSEWDYDFRPIIEDTIIYLRNDLDTYQIYYYSEYGDVNPLNKLTYTYEDENITLYAPVNSEEGK